MLATDDASDMELIIVFDIKYANTTKLTKSNTEQTAAVTKANAFNLLCW